MEILLVWFACAILGAIISNSKGRSPVAGALWGGLLGLIGVIVVACQRDLSK